MGMGGGGMNDEDLADDVDDSDVELGDVSEDIPPDALCAEFKDGNEGT